MIFWLVRWLAEPTVKAPYSKSLVVAIVPLCLGFSFAAAALRADVQSMWSLARPSTFTYWRLQMSTLLQGTWFAVPEYFVGLAPLAMYSLSLCLASSALVLAIASVLRPNLRREQLFAACLLLHVTLFGASVAWARVLARDHLIRHGIRERTSSNQAMQLTASEPAVCAWSVCRRERMLRGMHSGLAAVDLVTREVSCARF